MKPSLWLIVVNLFLVYISWGSTYIGLKFTLEVLGPFTTCGARMGLGGFLLCLMLMLTGRWRFPALADWRHAAGYGVPLVVMASGFLGKGQMSIDSTVAAVISGSTPITMLVAAWLFAGEKRPSLPQCFGLTTGLLGLVLLATSHGAGSGIKSTPGGMLWVLLATFGWVAGSLFMRGRNLPTRLSPLESCALLLLMGGLESLALAFVCGEASMVHWENLRPSVLAAFSWMVVGGAILAYSSYFWLLKHTSIATAVSYEYVVPVIGLVLGWQIGGESVNSQMVLASCLTVGSVFFVMWHKRNG